MVNLNRVGSHRQRANTPRLTKSRQIYKQTYTSTSKPIYKHNMIFLAYPIPPTHPFPQPHIHSLTHTHTHRRQIHTGTSTHPHPHTHTHTPTHPPTHRGGHTYTCAEARRRNSTGMKNGGGKGVESILKKTAVEISCIICRGGSLTQF